MNTRRDLLATLALSSVAGMAQTSGTKAEVLKRQPLPAPFDGWEAAFLSVTTQPGVGSPPHSHGGFVLGYVIEGEFRFAIDGNPPLVLKAGETFYEPPGARHTVSASARPDREVKVLAIVILEKGKEITR
ncbi:cupin domain-containing protein [Bryobacter aggregatus]|uniref:cupin domain-containing protein n=1 Tax=Bryobacter aggregatus TaxID=360054 RepID=UPI00068D21BD|nr:cupin domain-containing protein [Bryobacter aggregatus]